MAVLGTGKGSEQHKHQAKPVCCWKKPSTLLLGAYPGLSLKPLHVFIAHCWEVEQCCYTESRHETQSTLVFCRGQDRHQHPHSSPLMQPQMHPPVSCSWLSWWPGFRFSDFNHKSTKARQSVALHWSVSRLESVCTENHCSECSAAPKINSLY